MLSITMLACHQDYDGGVVRSRAKRNCGHEADSLFRQVLLYNGGAWYACIMTSPPGMRRRGLKGNPQKT